MRFVLESRLECVYLLPTTVYLLAQFLKAKQRSRLLRSFLKLQVKDYLQETVIDPSLVLAYLLALLFLPEGLSDVILYLQPQDKSKNRGFCFLEYEDHKTAAQARRRLMSGKVKVWGNMVTVEWADPMEDPDPEVMAKVGVRAGAPSFSDCTFKLGGVCV